MEVRQKLGGRYKLLSELGTGGMAVVWRAQDEVLGRPVAVKLLAGRFAGDPQSRARIRDEARAAAALSHPNIAQVYDYGESTDTDTPVPYVVMELINGPTLQQRVAGGPLPARTVFRICGEVAAGLAAAHADGLVHRDIKMANIMVTPSGAKVVDFGIAAAVGPAAPEEMLVGTPAYLAPERLTGDAVQPASDVYALGVLLFRLLADQPPWSVESTTQMLKAHVYLEPDPLPDLPGVPPAVTDLVARCLRKDPADRPSAAEVSAILADATEASVPLEHANPIKPADSVRVVPRPADGDLNRPAGGHRLAPEAAVVNDAATGQFWMDGAVLRPAGAAAELSAAEPPKAPEEAGPAGAGGEVRHRVPLEKRRMALAATAVVALIGAALAAWLSFGGVAPAERARSAVLPSAATSVHGKGTGAAPPSAAAAAPSSRATAGPSRPVNAAAARRPSVSAAGSLPVSPRSPGATEPSVSAEPSASTSAPTTTAPEGAWFTSPGGVVYASCAGGRATLSRWEPASGFDVDRVAPGPALAAEIIFQGALMRYRTTVTCVANIPTPVTLPL